TWADGGLASLSEPLPMGPCMHLPSVGHFESHRDLVTYHSVLLGHTGRCDLTKRALSTRTHPSWSVQCFFGYLISLQTQLAWRQMVGALFESPRGMSEYATAQRRMS